MKLSARNQLKGKIIDVVKGATTSHVRIGIGTAKLSRHRSPMRPSPILISSPGDDAWAVIKASDVMIGK